MGVTVFLCVVDQWFINGYKHISGGKCVTDCLRFSRASLLASISSPWKELIRAAVCFVSITLPVCLLSEQWVLQWSASSISLSSHLSFQSAVPLCFPTYYLRCDASIAKLSADVSSGERRMIGLQQEVAELRSAVDVRLKELEVKVRDGALVRTKGLAYKT